MPETHSPRIVGLKIFRGEGDLRRKELQETVSKMDQDNRVSEWKKSLDEKHLWNEFYFLEKEFFIM